MQKKKKKAHVTHQVREEREKSVNCALVMESVFPTKVPFSAVLSAHYWNVPYTKSGCSSVSVPPVLKRERWVDRQTK